LKFTDSLRANIKKTLWRVNESAYKIARELFESVVILTPSPFHPGPWAEGWLANQWYPEENDFSEELDSNISSIGADSLRRIQGMRGYVFNQRDGKLTLTNNLHYAYRAEALGWPESEGWSGKTGPYRMIAKSLQLITAKYK
jgi:hypothetical protein